METQELKTVLVIRRVTGDHEVTPMPMWQALAAARRLGFTGGADVHDQVSTDPTVRHAWVSLTRNVDHYRRLLG